MDVYIYKIYYCEKDEMKGEMILRRHNRLETITLIRIVLGGICSGGQFPRSIARVQLSEGNFPR